MAANSQILGLKELSKKLDKLSELDRGKVIRSGANAAAALVVRKARENVPTGSIPHKTYKGRLVSPGFLSRSIKKTAKLSRDRQSIFVSIGVKSEAFYGLNFVELGTSRQSPRPWLRPALESSKTQAIAIMREKILANIEKIASKR